MATSRLFSYPAIGGKALKTVGSRLAPARLVACGSHTRAASRLSLLDTFTHRHIGPRDSDITKMLAVAGNFSSLDELTDATVPADIRFSPTHKLNLPEPVSETEALASLKTIAAKNHMYKSMIGMGYYGTITPGVILRNMIENPGFYTAYTPYQAEVSQGRLESLLNFQTMVSDLTGMQIANASLLDEGTAAAEAMYMCLSTSPFKAFFVADDCHPQTIGVVKTRASALGVKVIVGPADEAATTSDIAGVLLQYPNTTGVVHSYADIIEAAHAKGAKVVVASDLLALTLLKPPGEFGADVVVGSAQRFGVPMGYGGPHAGFFATKEEHMRKMPGRVIGVSRDSNGDRALRMAMQTREQHIRRDKATSNICTAQALLANVAACYGVYHGPEGLKAIAKRVNFMASLFAAAISAAGDGVNTREVFFDTVVVNLKAMNLTAKEVLRKATLWHINVRRLDLDRISVSFDETTTEAHLKILLDILNLNTDPAYLESLASTLRPSFGSLARSSPFMQHPVFNSHHSETQMLRYLYKLQVKDLSLNTSMISLGSCTMKLNGTSEMIPITWPEFANIHPFVPKVQAKGYTKLIQTLNAALAEITQFAAASTQPNSGAQGEYAGLLCIKAYHNSKQAAHRKVCLIPVSAHGTNPASAVMAGFEVVTVKSDDHGNVDAADLKAKVEKYKDTLGAFMITYPSTFGVFEEGVKEIIQLIHDNGGLVYMDGANMNAQVGLTAPGAIGADVCHLNLHKTFCIPHGGGGPGVGTICVNEKLAPFLPGHSVLAGGGEGAGVSVKKGGAVSSAPYGSAMILPIPWMYIHMLGQAGLKKATQVAILNANYMAKRLEKHYSVLYRGKNGQCAHEFILDMRPFKAAANPVSEEDVAKRLIDYGFHAPTMSWPVPGTLMVEPTESEDKGELDRFVDALILIRQEIEDVITGKVDPKNNVLKNAPHTSRVVTSDKWDRPYSREQAAFPAPWLKENKYWPTVGRVDNVYGDRHLVCSCPPLSDYSAE